MLGLRKGTVIVAEHEPSWQQEFADEHRLLSQRIGHLVLDIQHVGSTAVPGLSAKPIIDIAIAVRDGGKVRLLRGPLIAMGYLDRGDAGQNGGYLFVKESAPQVRTHHVHVVTESDPQWRHYLLFRDRLIADAQLRESYLQLKIELSKRYANDRRSYTQGKADFIRSALGLART